MPYTRMMSCVSWLPPNACSRVYTVCSLRSTVMFMTFAPKSTSAIFWSLPLSGNCCWISSNDDLLRDHRGGGQGQGDVFCARRHSLPAALHRIDHGIEVSDVAVEDCVLRQGLDGVTLDARASPARIGEFYQLHRGRGDIHPEQRRRFRLENIDIQIKLQPGFSLQVWPVKRD